MSVDSTARTRTLHSKRSFGKYPRPTESPAYDASEEDNDPLTDDGSTVSVSVAAVSSRLPHPRGKAQQQASGLKMRHHLATAAFLSDSDGVDSPTYDGDVESSTAGHTTDASRTASMHSHHSASSTSTLSTPLIPEQQPQPQQPQQQQQEPVLLIQRPSTPEVDDDGTREPLSAVTSTAQEELVTPPLGNDDINPALFTPEGIQAFVKEAIEGESLRGYKINPPPTDRPVRVYADGVYDLFHFGHALQLRQAKLSFPSVYLLVGVNSDELVYEHKSRTVMNHGERIESVRHCRWADQVVPEAPWILDEEFLTKYQIDYVAHDDLPYGSAGHDDVYALCKSLGKFIPTRRTPGVSTSDLLKRIVAKYRRRDFDDKLAKIGHTELCAEGSDWDDLSLAGGSSRVSRVASPTFSRPPGNNGGGGGSNSSGGGDGEDGGNNLKSGYGIATGWSHLKVEAPSASVSSAGASFGSSRSASPAATQDAPISVENPVAEDAR